MNIEIFLVIFMLSMKPSKLWTPWKFRKNRSDNGTSCVQVTIDFLRDHTIQSQWSQSFLKYVLKTAIINIPSLLLDTRKPPEII